MENGKRVGQEAFIETSAPRFFRLTIFLALMAFPGFLLQAQLPGLPAPEVQPQEAVKPPLDREEIAAKLKQVNAEIALAQGKIKALGSPDPETKTRLERALDVLRRIDLVLQQQSVSLERSDQLRQFSADQESRLNTLKLNGPTEEKPYSYLLLDSVRDELATEASKLDLVETARKSAEVQLEKARARFEDAERIRRQAKEPVENNGGEDKKGKLVGDLRHAELESRLAAEAVLFLKNEVENERSAVALANLRIQYLQEKKSLIAPEARFKPDDLKDRLDELTRRQKEIDHQLDQAKEDLAQTESDWLRTRKRLESTFTENPELAEELDAYRLGREASQQRITLFADQLQRLEDMKPAWEWRYTLASGQGHGDQVTQWAADLKDRLKEIEREEKARFMRVSELRKDYRTIDSKRTLAEQNGQDKVLSWLDVQSAVLNELVVAYETDLVNLDNQRRLLEKLDEEVRAAQSIFNVWEQIGRLWDDVVQVWNYEITNVEERSITVGKIFIGLMLLITGTWLSRLISGFLGRRLFPLLGLNRSAVTAFQTLLFYFLLVLFTLIALRMINVPLTVFTVLGGALAIGVGFGSQNLMSNFISGLIIMAERPIKVGDLIQVNDLYGRVQRIGARSTRVKTSSNVDIIVPNSSFLDQNVVNWTHSDNRVRTFVALGVAYGSPVETVRDLLLQAVERVEKILKTPDPIVLFNDFGDNALGFEVHFWIHMVSQMERRVIESELRYKVNDLCHEKGISISFPQRDVHLDTLHPLEVRIVEQSRRNT